MKLKIFLVALSTLFYTQIKAQEVADKIYYPSLKVEYETGEPIIIELDGKMYNRPSKAIQIDKMTSGDHRLIVYRVRYKKSGKRKYREIFNGTIRIKPEKVNLAQIRSRGYLHMRYTPATSGMAYVDTKARTKKKTLRKITVIQPKYKEKYNAKSNNFMKLLNMVDETDYEEQKLNIIDRYLVEAEGISTSQVQTLSESFLFDTSKLDLVTKTRPYLLDKENIKVLTSIFEDESFRQRLLDIAY